VSRAAVLPDPFDARVPQRATGLLGVFAERALLTSADVHVAATLGRLAGESDGRVLLAAALTVKAVRSGSVCIDLAAVRHSAVADPWTELPPAEAAWPDPSDWVARCEASPMVAVGSQSHADRPLRLVDGLLYLDRYFRQQELVRAAVNDRAAQPPPPVDSSRLGAALEELFDGAAPDHQRLAAAACATGRFTVIAGGPGTGKTTTVARLLALLAMISDAPVRVALAAPTGKAAARMQEAVAEQTAALADHGVPVPEVAPARTLHRLLGSKPGSRSRFRHDASNRLPYDVVVVDETSMVSLTLMARLLAAVRPETRLILLGDPDQLASVEAGAVLGDLVHRPAPTVEPARVATLRLLLPADLEPDPEVSAELGNDTVRLRTVHRFGGAISELAEAVRTGDPEAALGVLRDGSPSIEFVETADPAGPSADELGGLYADVVAVGTAVFQAAASGAAEAALEALGGHRLLCAHRSGPFGVTTWDRRVQAWLAESVEGLSPPRRPVTPDEPLQLSVGQPLLVTANDYEVGLFNGDTGVVVDAGPLGLRAAFRRGGEVITLPLHRLSAVQSVHAMTVHRGQGSQFDRVTVLLPPADSPLATRELLYTAVTRAQTCVRVVATEEAVRAAVGRPVLRASGLRRRR